MRYLKKINLINENSGIKCDFETFKDIMLELTDNFTKVTFSAVDVSGNFIIDQEVDLYGRQH